MTSQERMVELLVQRALSGLTEDEEAELTALQAEQTGRDDPSMDVAAAAIDVAYTRVEPLPHALLEKLDAKASEVFAQPPGKKDKVVALSRRRPVFAWAGWVAAAACLALAIGAWLRGSSGGPPASAAEEREALLLGAKDAVVISWTATTDPAAQGAGGDVVWSESRQQGYMRFHGLAANDPARAQYQLWIFDKQQDERFPIDGGVFDVGAGDVVVPIHAKIRVAEPTLFAVTVEKPGGVVVSRREHVVVTAAFKTG